MRWNQGRAEVDAMLAAGELQRVPASREHADNLLTLAAQHLASARSVVATDPEGAYAIGYDASRKALAAVLENQGLRATSRGGHVAIYRAVQASSTRRSVRRSAPSIACGAGATASSIRTSTRPRSPRPT